eukprot:GHVH01013613.1.p1 GENE.GHVH01013613.1~~GHVH01013613.1.p1  ORF type:complete len:649 (-),score=103.81 GHVH01013613.1:2023-3969(-)
MPVNVISRNYLTQRLKDIKCEDDIDKLCFEFGTEFDGAVEGEDGSENWRIEVAANRYDLLSAEGVTQALRVFQDIDTPPKFTTLPPKETIVVDESAASIRPFFLSAVIRDVALDQQSYQSFIDLQDKLHHNICRKRELVSIGTHDLDTVEGPFLYTAREPENIKFVPLNREDPVDGSELMLLYSDHAQLKSYLPLIRNSPKYPVLVDSNDVVLSLPPIINGNHSKMSAETKNVLIDVTALDATKARIVLHVLVASLSMYTKKPYTVEQVSVKYDKSWSSGLSQATKFTSIDFTASARLAGTVQIVPDMKESSFTTSVDYIQRILGLPDGVLNQKNVCELLKRMLLTAKPTKGSKRGIDVICPITRSDILHECDISEDVGIAFGYNKITPRFLNTASERGMGSLDHQIRLWMGQAGFNEVLNWGLVSTADNFDKFGISVPLCPTSGSAEVAKRSFDPYGAPAILGNAKTAEFEIVRTSLLAGMLKTLSHNRAARQPIQLFELGNTVVRLDCPSTQSVNRNHFGALYSSNTSAGFEVIHGIIDYMLMKLQLTPSYYDLMDENVKDGLRVKCGIYFKLEERVDPAFIKNRSVNIVACSDSDCTKVIDTIGRFGILKPSILKAFSIPMPTTAMEINLEYFMDWMPIVDQMDE